MYLNQFSVRIPEGNEKSGYVELNHNQRYTLVLRNSRNVRCDAKVEVDGNEIGVFRIAAHDNVALERSPINDGYFTFVDVHSVEAQQGGLNNCNPNLGLVKVTFTPEVEWKPTGQIKGLGDWREIQNLSCSAEPQSKSYRGSRSGGTVASGHSNQQFRNVGSLVLDSTQRTTINLRLVLRDNSPTVRPLTQRETPVPPRL